jgi:hypothetical protein
MARLLVYILLTLSLVGCATPYQPFELFGRGGYQDQRISEDMYEVAYYGNHVTSMQTLNALLLYRSAELTLDCGYDYFEVINGYARMPLSSLGGFRIARHTIKMRKGQSEKKAPSVYVAREVVKNYGPFLSQQK